MEILNTVEVDDVIDVIEHGVFEFIVKNIDVEYDDEGGIRDSKEYFDEYDKNKINLFLSKMKKKQLKKIAFAAKTLYDFVISFDVKIHKNAFYSLAFLKDLNDKSSQANTLIKSLSKNKN